MTAKPRFVRVAGIVLVLAFSLSMAGCGIRLGEGRVGAQREAQSEQAAPPPAESQPGTRFSLQRRGDHWWIVPGGGEPFFSRGVCVVGQGPPPEAYDPENPEYAAWRFYDTTEAWALATTARLRSWGFTTVGAWSEQRALRDAGDHGLLLTPVLHLGATVGAPWWDMWDQQLLGRMEELAGKEILQYRDDPRVVGYYSDNELGWWNATLWKMTLEQSAESGQRARLVDLLRATYAGDWNRLLLDFEPENASTWGELRKRGMLYLRPGGGGVRVQRAFLSLLAARYYQVVHDIIRRWDPGALVLGDRYQSFYYPEVIRAAAPWVDAISSNLNANWTDGAFVRFHLETLHQLAQKPVLVGEYYMAAQENRSGNRNSHGVFPTVATQSLRATAASNTLGRIASLPWVVGADWFQYFDEPRYGRPDGENFNFGLVDIHDQPYDRLIASLRAVDVQAIRAGPQLARPDASLGIPPAPPDPFADFTPSNALGVWDRERGFVRPSSPFPMADLYVCWSPDTLYLGLHAMDVTEDAHYRDKRIPKQDRALWTIQVDGRAPFHARLGAGRQPIPSDPEVRLENLSGVNLTVRNIAAVALPAAKLGRERFESGDRIDLHSTFVGHLGTSRVEWGGTFILAE